MTGEGPSGAALGGFTLTDPYRHVPFQLTRPDRVLTGADFDVESMVRLADAETIDAAQRYLQEPGTWDVTLAGITAWGRRPVG